MINLEKHRILITGACGMIGQALTNRLTAQGASVIGFARRKSREVVCPLVTGDLLDKSFLMKAFNDAHSSNPITMVFHLAGLSDANRCDEDPYLAFEMNTVMTLNVLEAMGKNNIRRLIFPSSAYVYGTNYQQDITEDFVIDPPGIYAKTKLAAETMIRCFCECGKLDGDILRIGNIYGPQLNLNTVIGTLVAQSEKGGKITLQNFSPVRDFIYIDDVVEALTRLMMDEQSGYHLYNLSRGQGASVGELAKLFCEVKGIAPGMIQGVSNADKKVSRLVLNNDALYQRLQWRPKVDLKEGLRKTLELRKSKSQ